MAREITKVVLKATLFALLSVVGAAIVLLLLLSFTAPAAMARFTRDLGLYQQSAWYSSLQYADGNGDISNIEMSMNCSALVNDEEGVVSYGVRFIEDERFAAYCAEREEEEAGKYVEPYTQYVYGRVSLAYYRIGKKQEALSLALSANTDSFDEYNAVKDLAEEAVFAQDKDFAQEILSELTALQSSGKIANLQYLDEAVEVLTAYTSK